MPTHETSTAHDLRLLLAPLHRAVARAGAPSSEVASFSPAQLELLRLVGDTGPTTTTQIAARLSLARPTVSNLVKNLTQADMLTRELSPTDYRSVLIDLSPSGRQRLEAASEQRLAVLQEAIDTLTDDQRANLVAALPALRHVLHHLQEAGRA